MNASFTFCDVFTDRPLEGNQLAVFPDATSVPEARLQSLAKEIGFAETVFVYAPTDAATSDARMRIFTPVTELPFAGHPVLGTAAVLAADRGISTVRLETGKGVIPVEVQDGFGRMAQPIPAIAPFDSTDAVLAALGVARSELPVDVYDNGVRHVYVVLADEEAVAAVRPDFGALAAAAGQTGVSCVAGSGRTWKTRMFIPGAGVDEDAATGSAAGPLAVHLARNGRVDWGTTILIAQGQEIGRPSSLLATALAGPDGVTRVEVAGSTVIVATGTFTLPD